MLHSQSDNSGFKQTQPQSDDAVATQGPLESPGEGESTEDQAIRAELTIDDGSNISWPCLVWSITPGCVTLMTDSYVPVRSKVKVRGRFAGEVTHCVAGEGGFKNTIRLSENDGVGNRRDPRFTLEMLAMLSSAGALGVVREEIEVVDFSATGLGIRVRPALEPGRVVMVELQTCTVFGEVRHCTAEDNGWHRVGISLGSKSRPCYFASQFIWKLRTRFGPK